MARPVPHAFSGASRLGPRAFTVVALIALCGCSINLGSLSPELDKDPAPKPAPTETSTGDAQADTARGQALARSGKTEEALAEFDKAIALDPHYAEALYDRGLLYQGEKRHQLAVPPHRGRATLETVARPGARLLEIVADEKRGAA